jgi:S1-C subfamily serine protease
VDGWFGFVPPQQSTFFTLDIGGNLAMTRLFIHPLVIAGCVTILMLADALCQQPQAKRSPAAGERAEHPVVSRVPANMLAQFSGSLEQLAAKVSPAVVQIQVTGFGPVEESGRADTALIVRQHALGSGVIVDPDGYIMTNAHVV